MNYKKNNYLSLSLMAASISAMALLLTSCQKPTCSNCNFAGTNSNSSASTPGGGGTPTGPGSPVGTFTIQANTVSQLNLGTSQTIPVQISADSVYSGSVALSISEPELLLLDKGAAITFSISPSTVSLTPGSSASVNVTINAGTLSPDFASSMFHIIATDTSHPAGQGYVTSIPVPLSIKAMYTVNIKNGSGNNIPEDWTVAAKASVSFINHPGGITMVFNNLDMDTVNLHRIHSNAGTGLIQHQPGSLSASLDGVNPNPNGGTYTQVVTAQTLGSNGCYDHNIESGNEARTFIFNTPVVAASPPPITNPNAKYSYLNTNILQPMCVSCHNPTNKQGGYDLSTYASVLNAVQVNSSLTSPLYQAVAGGSMPLNGTPLSGAQVQDFGDWINSGAPNN